MYLCFGQDCSLEIVRQNSSLVVFHSVFCQATLLSYKKYSKLMVNSLTSKIVISMAIL